jgi:putative transposase
VLELENLALRHQIGVLQRSARKRIKLTPTDRLLRVLAVPHLERLVFGAGHRQARNGRGLASCFRRFWTWKVRRGQPGRLIIVREARDLIRQMCRENPGWSAPRIHGELLKLGIKTQNPKRHS